MNNIEISPASKYPWDEPRFETANQLFRDNKYEDAISVYNELLTTYPDHPRALHASGFLLHKTGCSGEAIDRIRKAIVLKPDFAHAYNSLGSVYMHTGQIPEALQSYLKAINLAPDCYGFYSNYLLCLECNLQSSAEKRFREALACANTHFSSVSPRTSFSNLIDPEKPLRIGLVSPDLGIHPVGMFLLPLLDSNNREKYRFICYSLNDRHDEVAIALKENSLLWRDISQMSDEESCRLIEYDRIDILVDLSGYTGDNRLSLFARRAAPVQVTWLGYSSTTAVPVMDYIFTDATAVLPGEECYFTEKVFRFAPSRFCYLPIGKVPEVAMLPLSSKGYCTFGSFNNLAKLSPEVIALWSKVMHETKDSRIVLKNRFFTDTWLCNRYLELFKLNGISSDRIEFRQFSSHSEMLAEYADIDVALDPFPFCGGMTSCNALWMGVPIVTLSGDRPLGRQTQGFLELAGLSELIASTQEEYIAIAVELASNRKRLADIRTTLRDKLSSSPLCDPISFAQNFEKALRLVWQNWCAEQHISNNQPWDDLRFEEAYRLFQTALHDGRIPEEAYKLYIRLLSEYPDHPRALHALGVVLHTMGESDEGIAHIKRAILLKPDFADAYSNLGNVYNEIKDFVAAEACFRKFVELKPDNHVALKNLARALLENGKREEALSYCKKSIEILPDYADGLLTIGNILMAMGDAAKALEFTRNANRIAPADSAIHSNLIHTMNFVTEVKQEDIFKESLCWGECHANKKISRRPHLNTPDSHKKLRVGYVSGDFKLHPVSYHLKPVIAHHDRNSFEIYLYSTFKKSDVMTESLKEYADHWRMVTSLSDECLEEMIRVDGIDILVDLSGHTAFNRLELFARKPAPVQISWIGYYNTTGMKAMDYLISDEITIPVGEDRWISEKVVRMPNGRFCYEPPFKNTDLADLPAQKNGFVTFGSFNKLVKVTRETVSLWSAVLKAIAGSRLVLKTHALNEQSAQERIIKLFDECGVEADRLELRGDSPYLQMLEQYGDIDVALDTFPFNGGVTTCEALWMGVPVVTLSGHLPISRQSASLLASCGLASLVAYTQDEFVSIATALSANILELAKTRATMRDRLNHSPLYDGHLFAGNLERAYREMWYRWCDSRKDIVTIPYSSKTSFNEYFNAAIDRMDHEDDQSAILLLKYALRKKPDAAEAYNNLGISLSNLGKEYYRQAAFCLRKAISFDPLLGEAYKNLGRVLDQMKQTRHCQEALDAFETAVKLMPYDADALYMLANFRVSLGQPTEALALYKKAMQLAPDNANIMANTIFAMNYLPEYSQATILSESLRWDQNHGWKGAPHDFRDRRRDSPKLRIGYVSGDLHKHPVGIFFQAVAVNHDREFCEIYCYSNRDKIRVDEVRTVIRHNVEFWRDVKELSDDALYSLILSDKIDILVDLSGYTAENRLQVFSRRAAPVQVSWLGYYNTTGISNIDYVISDETTVPTGFEKWYSEKVVRLPHSRFCYTPSYVCPDVEPLAATQTGRITFGSFNNFSKLTEDVIEAWAQILLKVPKSRIVLKWKNFTDKNIKKHYQLLFSIHGISARRIEFRDASPAFLMQDEYNDIDIALDPFPFSGGLTSCEALWMGVPVVTYAGDRPVSRQTAGFLRAIGGLDELIAESLEEYIDKAVSLAGDIQYLAELKAGLRQRFENSPLCDGKQFTVELENIYRGVWNKWKQSSAEPCSFRDPAE